MINKLLKPVAYLLPENNTLERIWVLAKVDFKSRYYYHRLGVLWALIRPIIELIVYYTIFKTIFSTSVDNFALYLCGGLLLWYFFTEGTSKGINALLSKRYLIESVPFNKVYILIASTLSSLMGFGFNFIAYIIISFIIGAPPEFPYVIQLIPILLVATLLIFGISLLLATLSIYLKDIEHLWDMVTLAGFWMTPIVYDESLMLEKMPLLVYLNPVAPLVIILHEALLYDQWININYFLYAAVISFTFFILGWLVFSKYSHKAAEKL